MFFRSIIRTIYVPRASYRRTLDCLAHVVQRLPEPRCASVCADLVALGSLGLTLGVRYHVRGAFWQYVCAVLTMHRERFTLAMRLAVRGYHLRTLVESHCGCAAFSRSSCAHTHHQYLGRVA
jgi:hypothetical protein